MKSFCRSLLALCVLFSALSLASCGNRSLPAEAAETSSPDVNISPDVSAPETSAEPQTGKSRVRTDYSYLTPYEPEIYPRFSEGPQPDLVPSPDHGMLLPYIGDLLKSDNGYGGGVILYGFATKGGKIATDPVYTNIEQGSFMDPKLPIRETKPVYIMTRVFDADHNLYAVCGTDGSWVTTFDYSQVELADEVIFLVRDYRTNDIDVMNYSGRLLLSLKDLGCYGDIRGDDIWGITHGCREGVLALPLKSGGTVWVDVETHEETYTDYEEGEAFSEGMAAVKVDGLYGYIDRDFRIVIEPQFWFADPFYEGKANVSYSMNSYAVIDKSGNVLYKCANYPYRSIPGFFRPRENVFLDSELNLITMEGHELHILYSGWLYYLTADGATVFREGESYDLPGADGVGNVTGDLAIVTMGKPDVYGVMTLSGELLIPPDEGYYVTLVRTKDTAETLIVRASYENNTYSVLDRSGNIVFGIEGGSAWYDENCGLFRIYCEDWFGYVDMKGNYIFKYPLTDPLGD
ncbi:MAG: WG repeat-containing protein [Clostridiales bacterium]|jgi:hypothetical protein|nr:WG repeat-containing protein [Clostridiales bacterium]